MKSYRFIVRGRVQGVWYRASIKNEADRLGIKGYAKNLPDGTVEVMANLDEEMVDNFVKILKRGSPLSRVDDVSLEAVGYEDFGGFQIL